MYIKYTLILTFIFVLVGFIEFEVITKEKGMDKNNFKIRVSKIYKWVGIIDVVSGLGLAAAMFILVKESEKIMSLLVMLVSLPGIILCVYYYCWSIHIEDKQIHYKAPFKAKRTFKFSEITKAAYSAKNEQVHDIKVYVSGKKVFKVDSLNSGYHLFLAKLNMEGVGFELK